MQIGVAAKALKVTCLLDSTAFVGVDVPFGQPKVSLRIKVGERIVKAEVSAKGLRRVVTQLATGEECVVVIQGKLEGDVITEAGLVAQVKTPKPAVEQAA